MHDAPARFVSLHRSFKRHFGFRLSVPSFVYPAGYAANVRLLGSFVDEIELLLFESGPESLPSRSEIDELNDLSRRLDVSYNVHLPLDLELGDPDPARRANDVRRLIDTIGLARPLSPTTHTLHLNLQHPHPNGATLRLWQDRTLRSLERLCRASAVAPDRFTIETLDYPPEWLIPFVHRLGMRVCVDVGHVLNHGRDLVTVMLQFGDRIEMIHLHAAADGRDHLALDHLAPETRHRLQSHLRHFHGTVSLELFAFERLRRSLDVLDRMLTEPE